MVLFFLKRGNVLLIINNGITDKNGIFTTSYSPESTTTLSTKYNGSSENTKSTSTTVTITVQSYLFYDDCTTNNKLTIYQNTTQTALEGSSGLTINYDSTNKCYNIIKSNTGVTALSLLNNSNNIHFEAQMKITTYSGGNTQFGLALVNDSSNWVLPKIVLAGSIQQLESNTKVSGSSSNLKTTGFTVSTNTYYLISMDKNGTNLTVTIKNINGTVLITQSLTINSTFTNPNYCLAIGYSSGSVISFNMIKAKLI